MSELPRFINKNWFYGQGFFTGLKFNTFDASPDIHNNVMNTEDTNIITKSKDDGGNNEVEINRTYYLSLPKLVRHSSRILRLKRN